MLLLTGYVLKVDTMRLRGLEGQRKAGSWGSMTPEPLCAVMDRYAKPNEPVFIWGFDADLYLTCRRHVASRFTYLTLVAGNIPPFWTTFREEYVAKRAREDLVEDLRKARPPVILDIPTTIANNGASVSVQGIPKVKEFLAQHYCVQGTARAKNGRVSNVLVRNDLPACKK
jgi:hypothetical protein